MDKLAWAYHKNRQRRTTKKDNGDGKTDKRKERQTKKKLTELDRGHWGHGGNY